MSDMFICPKGKSTGQSAGNIPLYSFIVIYILYDYQFVISPYQYPYKGEIYLRFVYGALSANRSQEGGGLGAAMDPIAAHGSHRHAAAGSHESDIDGRSVSSKMDNLLNFRHKKARISGLSEDFWNSEVLIIFQVSIVTIGSMFKL